MTPPPRNPLAERGQAARVGAKARCNHCKAVIVWALTPGGERMPVDVDPVSTGGNLILMHDDKRGLVVSVLGTPAKRRAHAAAGWPLHQHHRLSCPFADSWNTPGGPKRSAARRGR